MRRFMHQAVHVNEAIRYQSVQLYEVKRLLFDLIRTPEEYELWFERFSAGVFLQICYGKISRTGKEPFIRDCIEVVHTLERVASPGAYLVDIFPILMHLPDWLAPFKREGNRLHKRELDFYTNLLDDVRREVQQGNAPRTIATTMLDRQAEFGFSDVEAAYTLGALYIAAAGTTSATMMSFCLAMCRFPQWQERLQEEVDRVVGQDRLPNFEDSSNMPVTRAITKEVMRVWPVTAGGEFNVVSQPYIQLR
jgi:hypothetical protein